MKEPNPFKGRCDRCKFYKNGYCPSIESEVEGWWTGCIRWIQKATSAPPQQL